MHSSFFQMHETALNTGHGPEIPPLRQFIIPAYVSCVTVPAFPIERRPSTGHYPRRELIPSDTGQIQASSSGRRSVLTARDDPRGEQRRRRGVLGRPTSASWAMWGS